MNLKTKVCPNCGCDQFVSRETTTVSRGGTRINADGTPDYDDAYDWGRGPATFKNELRCGRCRLRLKVADLVTEELYRAAEDFADALEGGGSQ